MELIGFPDYMQVGFKDKHVAQGFSPAPCPSPPQAALKDCTTCGLGSMAALKGCTGMPGEDTLATIFCCSRLASVCYNMAESGLYVVLY